MDRDSAVNSSQLKKEDSEYLKIKWTNSRKEDKILIKNISLNYSKKRVSVPTQQYFNGAYMEETVNDITNKIRQRKKSITCTDKEEFDGSFDLKKTGNNTMHTFFYSNISEFTGNLEVILDEVRYRTTVQNIHKLGWKSQYFKSSDVLMLVHSCCVSQYPQFYDTNK